MGTSSYCACHRHPSTLHDVCRSGPGHDHSSADCYHCHHSAETAEILILRRVHAMSLNQAGSPTALVLFGLNLDQSLFQITDLCSVDSLGLLINKAA